MNDLLAGLMIHSDDSIPEFTPGTRVDVMRCVNEQQRTIWRVGDLLYAHPNTVLWFCTEFARIGR